MVSRPTDFHFFVEFIFQEAQGELVAHHVTAGRMNQRKYRARWRKNAGAGQTTKRKNGNTRKIWEKKRIRFHDKGKGM